jgi:hypothetical protein
MHEMATTRLTDVIYGPMFLPTTIQRTVTLSTIRTSGIAVDDPEIAQFANTPGDIVQMPFWNDISGDSNVSSDDPAQTATPNKITQSQDYARKLRRNNGWQAANLVAAVLAEDPLDVIAQLIAQYWVREEQTILGYVLNGVFAAANMTGNILNVASEDATASGVDLSPEVAANAFALLGDQGTALSAIMMHSRVYWNLYASRYIVTGVDPATNQEFSTWEGKRVIVNDALPRVAGATSGFKYTSYLFAAGSIGYAEATGAAGPKKPVELDTAPSAGNGEGVDTIWYRRHFILHPRGVKFNSASVAGASPTNAELATAANWTRVYDPKNVRIVAVVTNG